MPAYRYHPHVPPSPVAQHEDQSAMEQYDVFDSSWMANGSLTSQYDDSMLSSCNPDRAGYSTMPSYAPHCRRSSYENPSQVSIFSHSFILVCISFIRGYRRDVATMAKDTSTVQGNHDTITKIPGPCSNQRGYTLIPQGGRHCRLPRRRRERCSTRFPTNMQHLLGKLTPRCTPTVARSGILMETHRLR